MADILYKELSYAIVGAAMEVHKLLGPGFLEKVYQKAMPVELLKRKQPVELESPINVKYKDLLVVEYYADLFVDKNVIVELKASPEYNKKDEAQLLNLLKATGIKIGLLINFEKEKVEFKKFI